MSTDIVVLSHRKLHHGGRIQLKCSTFEHANIQFKCLIDLSTIQWWFKTRFPCNTFVTTAVVWLDVFQAQTCQLELDHWPVLLWYHQSIISGKIKGQTCSTLTVTRHWDSSPAAAGSPVWCQQVVSFFVLLCWWQSAAWMCSMIRVTQDTDVCKPVFGKLQSVESIQTSCIKRRTKAKVFPSWWIALDSLRPVSW